MMNPTPKKLQNLGPLHDLLLRACPPDDEGRQSIPRLAEFMGTSHQNIYKWIANNRIPTVHNRASKLVELSNGRLTMLELMPYISL